MDRRSVCIGTRFHRAIGHRWCFGGCAVDERYGFRVGDRCAWCGKGEWVTWYMLLFNVRPSGAIKLIDARNKYARKGNRLRVFSIRSVEVVRALASFVTCRHGACAFFRDRYVGCCHCAVVQDDIGAVHEPFAARRIGALASELSVAWRRGAAVRERRPCVAARLPGLGARAGYRRNL